jgi:nucleoside-diphosphate-sugar epimerase
MRKRVLICGCGYVGQGVGASLAAQGHVVFGVRRSVESNASLLATGITPLNGDLVNPADVAALPGPFDWVINVVSSAHGGEAAYRSAYLESTRNLVRVFARSPCRFVYTSSTSVYAQTDGEWVAEDSTTSPATVTGLSFAKPKWSFWPRRRRISTPRCCESREFTAQNAITC